MKFGKMNKKKKRKRVKWRKIQSIPPEQDTQVWTVAPWAAPLSPSSLSFHALHCYSMEARSSVQQPRIGGLTSTMMGEFRTGESANATNQSSLPFPHPRAVAEPFPAHQAHTYRCSQEQRKVIQTGTVPHLPPAAEHWLLTAYVPVPLWKLTSTKGNCHSPSLLPSLGQPP